MNERPLSAPAPAASTPAEVFAQAFQHSPAMQTLVRSADGVIVEVNAAFLHKLGFSRHEVVGRSADSLNFWPDEEELAAYRTAFELNGVVSGREVRLRARTGRELHVLLSSHRIRINGEHHVLSAGIDITARKDVEALLRESEARLGSAFRACPVLMTIARLPNGEYVEANDAFAQWIGR